MNTISAIIDILLLVFFVLMTKRAYNKGFARVVLELAAYFLALALSSLLASPVSNFVYDTIEPSILSQISSKTSVIIDENFEKTIEKSFNEMPKIVSNTARYFGQTPQAVTSAIKQNAPIGSTISIKEIVREAIKPSLLVIIKGFVTIILFLVLLGLFKTLVNILDKFFKIPIIGLFNHTLGGFMGFVKACIIIVLLSTALELFINFTNDSSEIINSEIVDQTYIYKYIHQNNPITDIVNGELKIKK